MSITDSSNCLDPPLTDSKVHWRITILCTVPDEVQMGGVGPLRHMIINRRRANPILHLIQLIVLEYGADLLLDRKEARRLYMVVSLLMPPCDETMSGVKEPCSTSL